jgi:hypothetical protein
MFKSTRKCQISLVLLFLVVMLVQAPRADTADSTSEKKLPEFVSEVVKLNMTEYKITDVGYGFYFPSEYGGVVKEESISFKLVSNRGEIYTVYADAIFLNGFISSLHVDEPTDASIFFVDPPTNASDESRNILQRYKTFAEKYGFDTAHIDQALTLLSNVTGASSAHSDSNLLNDITGFVPSVTGVGNMKQETEQDSITWVYTERGVDIPQKCLKIDFGSSQLHFVDAWNLFTVGCFSVISEDEAMRIGWDAANNYNLTFIGKDGPYYPQFEWSNRAYAKLDLVPGQILNTSIEDSSINLGNTTRNPLALYPRWFMVFYFKNPIPSGQRSIAGIAVDLWGDTKEVISTGIAQSFWDATIENPYASTESSSTQTESTTPSPEPNPTSEPLPATLVAVASVVSVTVVSASLLFHFKKRKH